MATCTVSGTIKDVSETAIEDVVVRANIITPVFASTSLIVPKELTTTTDASGAWSLVLSQGAYVVITIDYPPNLTDSAMKKTYAITVPASGTAAFSTLATEL